MDGNRGLTRRQVAASLLTALPLAAQTQPSLPKPDLLADAREGRRRSGEELRQFAVPIATEPSFSFKP